MIIPFVDLNAQYLTIREEIDEAVHSCINEGSYIRGKSVFEFEKIFAAYLGVKYCVGCGNGTDALEIILRSLEIGPGDEVIVPALSWIATAEAVNNVGAEPVFVDINPATFTIDASRIEEKINKHTKALIPVHLYGCPAEMNRIQEIAGKYNLYIIEDCAQAHGAEYEGKKTGTFGTASAFSFFPSKNLGAFGDAGAIVTDNEELYQKIRKISNHGQLEKKHQHTVIGRNSRLDTLQASILKVKLPHLDDWNQMRIGLAMKYNKKLADVDDLITPSVPENTKHVFHLFVLRSKRRDAMIKKFNNSGISWSIHYPAALPFIDAYKYKGHQISDFPVAGKITDEIFSIPIYPELTEDTLNFICNQILESF